MAAEMQRNAASKETVMPDKTEKCAHPACQCTVDAKQKYCSESCHDAAGTLEISCNCGHAGCSVVKGAPAMTP